MIKIIAGEYGSRTLKTLKGDNTRPTSSKVRGAIFSRIGPYFDKGKVLDLFGGSGAFSFECLSRGYNKAYIVDASFEAINIIKENSKIFTNKEIIILKADYKRALINMKEKDFDLIFLDPPYKMKISEDLIKEVYKKSLLKSGGILIYEGEVEDRFINEYEDIYLEKEAIYGISKIAYYRRK